MAITGEVKIFNGATMSPRDLALLLEECTTEVSGKIYGCTPSVSGNNISVDSGWCVIRGRIIQINAGSITIPYASSGTETYYVVVCLNTGASSSTEAITIEARTNIPSDSVDFNVYGGTAYFSLATLEVTTNTIRITKITSKMLRVGDKLPNTVVRSGVLYQEIAYEQRSTVYPLFSASFIQSIFNDPNIDVSKVSVNVANSFGDISKDVVKVIGTHYDHTRGYWYVLFDRVVSGGYRFVYSMIYTY